MTPSLVSQHDPKVVYFGGNRLFISRDRGLTWERTQDLTRQIDRDTLRLMGVLGSERMLSKNDGEQSFSEITTIAPDAGDVDGFATFMERYRKGLVIEQAAVGALR